MTPRVSLFIPYPSNKEASWGCHSCTAFLSPYRYSEQSILSFSFKSFPISECRGDNKGVFAYGFHYKEANTLSLRRATCFYMWCWSCFILSSLLLRCLLSQARGMQTLQCWYSCEFISFHDFDWSANIYRTQTNTLWACTCVTGEQNPIPWGHKHTHIPQINRRGWLITPTL